ncbi:hypothetical protein FGO68_gene3681 [Halteria grandinella]|uniref:Uncharacterized protein n=1 Tax=Halteria grandinella TaxID=5974 RepID=A0A8J8NSJ7_HALGN|nr:hypothetical protein FGO68_gene3681 [Halteria grandinella]
MKKRSLNDNLSAIHFLKIIYDLWIFQCSLIQSQRMLSRGKILQNIKKRFVESDKLQIVKYSRLPLHKCKYFGGFNFKIRKCQGCNRYRNQIEKNF